MSSVVRRRGSGIADGLGIGSPIIGAAVGATHEGDDLRSGAGAPVDAEAAVPTLASFLSAAGESYRYVLEHPDSEPENLDLFPLWVAEAAYLNADELATFDLDDEGPDDTLGEAAGQAKFIGVVFQQGDDAAEALEILYDHGWQAAIKHLAQWDFGRETDDAAQANGHVYDEVPIGEQDIVCVSGDYVMTYNQALGYVGLVRKIDPSQSSSALLAVDSSGAGSPPRYQPERRDTWGWSWDESPWARPWSSPHPTSGPAHPPRAI